MTQERKAPTPEELDQEDRSIRRLRQMADFTLILIIQSEMGLEEAERHVGALKGLACRLFPGKGHIFDMVYGSRFRRVLVEKYNLS